MGEALGAMPGPTPNAPTHQLQCVEIKWRNTEDSPGTGYVNNTGCIHHQHFYSITGQSMPKEQPGPHRQVVARRTGQIRNGLHDFSVTLALGKPPDAYLEGMW